MLEDLMSGATSFSAQQAHENPNAQQNVGESRNAHFMDAATQQQAMAQTIKNRITDRANLTYPGPPGDD